MRNTWRRLRGGWRGLLNEDIEEEARQRTLEAWREVLHADVDAPAGRRVGRHMAQSRNRDSRATQSERESQDPAAYGLATEGNGSITWAELGRDGDETVITGHIQLPEEPEYPFAESFTPSFPPDAEPCHHCLGTGNVLTAGDLMRHTVDLLNLGETEVRERFMIDLFNDLLFGAPALAGMLPADITERRQEGVDNPGHALREKVFAALYGLAHHYDPEGRHNGLARLDEALNSYGVSLAVLSRPDGGYRGATLSEYHLFWTVLHNRLVTLAGDLWEPRFSAAWEEGFDYAVRHMMAAQAMEERSGFALLPAAKLPDTIGKPEWAY